MHSTFKVVRSIRENEIGGSGSLVNYPEDVFRDNSVSGFAANTAASVRQVCYGSSSQMREVWKLADQISTSDVPIVIQGQTGVGKEIVARHVHAQSNRASKPFLKVNCAAVPPELMESELFGYERGAFTGAFQRKLGIFELSDGGTLFLDEIGDMDLKLQSKLLQVLQDQEFRRLGGRELVRVDVRLLAATHRDLKTAIRNGAFREDLYYRLNVFTIYVPSLSERKEDIPAMVDFLIARHDSPTLNPPQVSPLLHRALQTYNWPGNVRELENVVRRLIVLRDPDLIANELLLASQSNIGSGERTAPPAGTRVDQEELGVMNGLVRLNQRAEKDAILAALQSVRWNRKKAAMVLKIDYKALLYKIKKFGIENI